MKQSEKDFLSNLIVIRDYWINEKRATTAVEKIDGFIFSMLSMFDGVSSINNFTKIELKQNGKVINSSYGGVDDYYEDDNALHECYYKILDEQNKIDGQA